MSHNKYQEFFEHAPYGVAIYEAFNNGEDFVFVDYNPAAQTLDGPTRDDVIGKRVTEVFPGVREFGLLDTFRRVWQSGEPEHHPLSLYRDDNLTFYRENYVAKLPSGYLTTSYRDETEEKQAERVFLKNAEAYRDLFEHSPIVLVRQDITQVTARLNELRQKGVSDLEAHLREHPDEIERLLGMIQMIDVNERAVELYGAKSKEHLIENWTHTLQDNSIESFLFGLKAIWEERKRFSFEGTQHTLDGRRLNILLESNINPQQDNAGRIIILSMQDITERVRLEKDKVRLEKQVRDAEKMQAIGRLGGGVAHEFNNMLCTISGNASLALSDLPTGDPVRESIEDIKDASDRAAQLTRQLLAFSQKQIRTALNLDISQILNDLYPTLAQRINANITLRFSPQKHLGLIHVDPRHLQQIIIDLAINAQDAMPDGGELLIETSEAELPKELCLPNETNLAGSCVTLRVSDTGQGIDPEIRQKIFEPFFTTRDQSKNSGLRLPTVFGVVKQNGGYIKVSSEPGKGSSFVVYFPKTAAPHESPNTDEVIPLTGGNETILVVDDEKMVCTLAVRLLKRLGYNVLSAHSGADAISVAEKHEGKIDLLLTDVVMPHMDGHELAGIFMKSWPKTKIVYTSGYTREIINPRGELGKETRFIGKPFLPHSLSATIREALDE